MPRIKNYGLESVATSLSLHFAADFADIFEVRGMKRQGRGQDLPPEVTAGQVILSYRGLDGVTRRSLLNFSPPPAPNLHRCQSPGWSWTLRPQQEGRPHANSGL